MSKVINKIKASTWLLIPILAVGVLLHQLEDQLVEYVQTTDKNLKIAILGSSETESVVWVNGLSPQDGSNYMRENIEFTEPLITYKVLAHNGKSVALEIDSKAQFFSVGDELNGYGLIESISTNTPLKIWTERGLVSTL